MKRFALYFVGFVALSLVSAGALANPRPQAQTAEPMSSQAADSMSQYRALAGEALAAYKSGDKSTAANKAQDLEKAWGSDQNAVKSKSPDTWKAVDDAMDAFVKVLKGDSASDAAAVQAAYDNLIAKLEMASKP